jgi:hypothetical protein
MQLWLVEENEFGGKVQLSSGSQRSFYSYSLWRTRSGEHLFDGAAGDLSEAMDTMRAHIRYLSAVTGLATREQ